LREADKRAAFLSVEAAKVNARIAAGTSTPADLRTYLSLTRAIAGLIRSLCDAIHTGFAAAPICQKSYNWLGDVSSAKIRFEKRAISMPARRIE
jgi:hypothetical protein